MSNPVASVEIQAHSSGLAAQLREARAKFGKFADGVRAAVNGIANIKIGSGSFGLGKHGMLGDVAKGFSRGLGNQALGMVEGAAESTLDFEKTLTNFGVAARKTPADIDAVRNSVNALSKETGMSRLEILQGRRSLVDLAGAAADSDDQMSMLAKTSKATGAEMSDVVGTVYALRTGMHVSDPEMLATLSGLVNQSKDGAVHFNQLAQELTSVAPQFANFGVVGREGAIELGALFQVTRAGFKDASETATGLGGIFKGLGLHADRFAQAGVKIFNVSANGTKTFRPLSQIFKEIDGSILAKNPDFLMKAFGRGEGYRAYDMIRKQRDKYYELIEAGQKANTVSEDYGTVMASSSGRIEKAMNAIKVSIAEAITPERLERFAAVMERVAAAAGHVVDYLDKAAQAIDFMANGPGLKEGTAHAEQELFLNGLNEGSVGDQKRAESEAVRHAKMFSNASDEEIRKHDTFYGITGRDRFGSPGAVRAAARKFLKSEGLAEVWDQDTYDSKSAPSTQREALQKLRGTASGDQLQQVMASMIPLLQKIANNTAASTEVKVDADVVARSSKDASVHRRGVAK